MRKNAALLFVSLVLLSHSRKVMRLRTDWWGRTPQEQESNLSVSLKQNVHTQMASSKPWAIHVAIKREEWLIYFQLTFHLPNIKKEWSCNLTSSRPKILPSARLINPHALISSPKRCLPRWGYSNGHDPSFQSKRFVFNAVCHLSSVEDITITKTIQPDSKPPQLKG